MRSKIIVAVLFISVFAMNANAFCAELCAGGHGKDAHAASADKNGLAPSGGKQGDETHSCHHYANPQTNAASHGGHDKGKKDGPHACRVTGHEDDARAISAKATKTTKSLPVIECNCMDESGAFAPETEAPISEGIHASPAFDLAADVAIKEARPLSSEFIPPEGPPKIS